MAGFDIGIICLETTHPLLPGNVQHAGSFPFPVLYAPVAVDEPRRLMSGDPVLTEWIIDAARKLRRRGVRAICGACGSFGFYQQAVAAAVDVPVFLTPLMMAPLILCSLSGEQKLGVVCGAAAAIDDRLLSQSGLHDTSRLAFGELAPCDEFNKMVAGGEGMDVCRFKDEVRSVVAELCRREPLVGALLLQCSDLPPFGTELQERTGLPIFDMTRLIPWVQAAVRYPAYV